MPIGVNQTNSPQTSPQQNRRHTDTNAAANQQQAPTTPHPSTSSLLVALPVSTPANAMGSGYITPQVSSRRRRVSIRPAFGSSASRFSSSCLGFYVEGAGSNKKAWTSTSSDNLSQQTCSTASILHSSVSQPSLRTSCQRLTLQPQAPKHTRSDSHIAATPTRRVSISSDTDSSSTSEVYQFPHQQTPSRDSMTKWKKRYRNKKASLKVSSSQTSPASVPFSTQRCKPLATSVTRKLVARVSPTPAANQAQANASISSVSSTTRVVGRFTVSQPPSHSVTHVTDATTSTDATDATSTSSSAIAPIVSTSSVSTASASASAADSATETASSDN